MQLLVNNRPKLTALEMEYVQARWILIAWYFMINFFYNALPTNSIKAL